MKKVWYVYSIDMEYGNVLVESIHSTEEKAENRKKELNNYYNDDSYYKISDYILDNKEVIN